MPIAPNFGLIPCGSGSLVAECQCCYDQFACSIITQSCGPLGCVDNPGFFGCGAGQQQCGTGCIADGDVCCGSGGSYCSAGYQCDNSSDKCIPNGSDTTGSSTAPGAFGPAPTATTSTFGQGASQAVSPSGGEAAFGCKVTGWRLLALQILLPFFT
jgi:hypothetical protein